MTAVLKGWGAASKARPLASIVRSGSAAEHLSDPAQDELRNALLSLADAEQHIAALKRSCVEARAEGYEEGFQSGRVEAAEKCNRTSALLEEGISAAQDELRNSLRSGEQLAAVMAKTCLDSIIGDSPQHADLVVRALRNQLARLEAQSVFMVAVSEHDFADAAALDALSNSTGAKITVASELARGECRISVSLGSLDVGPATQWRRLSEVLDELADA